MSHSPVSQPRAPPAISTISSNVVEVRVLAAIVISVELVTIRATTRPAFHARGWTVLPACRTSLGDLVTADSVPCTSI
jgi:hypothetical protein